MIEQLGMRRHVAGHAEVVNTSHQSAAEQKMPDAIHNHAGEERVVLAGEPLGEFKPSALLRVDLWCVGNLDQAEEASRDNRAKLFRLAANADFSVGDRLRVAHSQHHRAADGRLLQSL